MAERTIGLNNVWQEVPKKEVNSGVGKRSKGLPLLKLASLSLYAFSAGFLISSVKLPFINHQEIQTDPLITPFDDPRFRNYWSAIANLVHQQNNLQAVKAGEEIAKTARPISGYGKDFAQVATVLENGQRVLIVVYPIERFNPRDYSYSEAAKSLLKAHEITKIADPQRYDSDQDYRDQINEQGQRLADSVTLLP